MTMNQESVKQSLSLLPGVDCGGFGGCGFPTCQACAQHIIEMIPREATNFIPCSSMADEHETLATCNYGCIGCGDCIRACPRNKIIMTPYKVPIII